MTNPLVRLSTVKAYIQPPGSPSVNQAAIDALLTRLIRAASAFALGWMGRDGGVGYQAFTEVRDGRGLNFLSLRNWPVSSITSIGLGEGTTITTQSMGNPPQPGWQLGDDTGGNPRLLLVNNIFPEGRGNITLTYMAGYRIVGEVQTAPASPGPYQFSTDEEWLGDLGLAYVSNGAALVAVSSTSPGPGQYHVDANGLYTVNAADQGVGIGVTYSYCPADIVQAVIELVTERYRAATRLGEISHTQGAQITVSYSQKDMNDTIKTFLRPYRSVVPV